MPRPLWYMVRATRPFEYLHLDFVSMPDSAGGHKHLLVIVDDLSLTTLLHPCARADADTVIDALLNHWLAHYPDPVLLHTDGGRHFDNRVVHGLAKLRGWDRATISTAYAKWTHGVADRMNRDVQDVAAPLFRHLRIEVNQ